MWCDRCQSDVAAETSGSDDRLQCRRCGHELRSVPRAEDAIRQAREILERWKSSDLFEQITSTAALPPVPWQPETPAELRSPGRAPEAPVTAPVESSRHRPLAAVSEALSDEAADQDIRSHAPPEPAAGTPDTEHLRSVKESTVSVAEAKPAVAVVEDPEIPDSPPRKTETESANLEDPRDTVAEEPEATADSDEEVEIPQHAATKSTRYRPLPPRSMPRTPIERTLAHRSAVSTESAGTPPVTRRLRVDQPGKSDDSADSPVPAEAAESVDRKVGGPVSNSASTGGRRIRIDEPQALEDLAVTDGRSRSHARPKKRYVDEAHGTGIRGPHFEVTPPRRSNLSSMTGQFLAYLGVLGLTIGTAIVIYGHFGGYAEYTPTGWLVTTVAQMLLFLGVINLVSGGIEQNNDDVSRRINSIGEQLLRIEQVTEQALRGPHIPIQRYLDPESEVEETQRERATVERD